MDESRELERRMIGEAPGLHVKEDDNGRTVIRGYAAVFAPERSQNLGGFVEVIEPGAFDDVMRSNPDVFGKYNHERVIGRTTSGTMRLFVDERGLRYEIDPPKSAADLVELIERGDIRGSSFAFRSSPKDETWEKDKDGTMVRRIKKMSYLGDAGPVDSPAYLATETYVSKRALDMAQGEVFEEPPEHPVLSDQQDDSSDAEMRAEPGELEVGDFVEWNSSGGKARGRIDDIETDGRIEVPGTDVVIQGTEENPAASITVYQEDDEGEYEASDVTVAHRFSALTKIEPLEDSEESPDGDVEIEIELKRAVSLKPTAGMASAARRGLELHEKGLSGDGLKPETVARANRLSRREEMNEDWVVEMNAWFARHYPSSTSDGWDEPPEYSPFFVAFLLWGGRAAMNWSARKVAEMERAKQNKRARNIAAELRAVSTLSKLRTPLHRNTQAT